MSDQRTYFRRIRSGLANFRSELKDSFLMAMGALVAHKLRSALTLLGVMIGVFSIIVVMTTMRAMQTRIESDWNQMGAQSFILSKWPAIMFEGGDAWRKIARRKNITLVNGVELRRRVALPLNLGLQYQNYFAQITSRYGKAPPGVSMFGESPQSFPVLNWLMDDGRALLDSDVDQARDVCVLGSALAKDLFPFGSPIGDQIRVDGLPYTVVGVAAPKGSISGSDQDSFLAIPITTSVYRYGGRWTSLDVLVQARDAGAYDDTVDEVRSALRTMRKVPPGEPDDFEIMSNDSLISQINTFTHNVRLGISLVSSIALLAAGIGIMNIMLVSVTERTREIGIRRAIGACKRNILVQFIMEAIVVCEVGGVAGVALGVGGGNIAAHFLKLPAVFPADWAIIGLVICSIVGLIFGTYPAWKAANVDPIESLRYE